MSFNPPSDNSRPSVPRRPSIPLQDLTSNATSDGAFRDSEQEHLRPPGPAAAAAGQRTTGVPSIATYWDEPYESRSEAGTSGAGSPIDISALQTALPPDWRQYGSSSPRSTSPVAQPGRYQTPYIEEPTANDVDSDDMAPLTSRAQPISGSLAAGRIDSQPRDSFQTVSDLGNGAPSPRATLSPGRDVEYGSRHRSYGMSLEPGGSRRGSRASSTSPGGALLRAGSIVRAMSQRVVNISGDNETVDQRASRHRSRSPAGSERSHPGSARPSFHIDTSYPSQTAHLSTAEKTGNQHYSINEVPSFPIPRQPTPNPLKGRTLGIFTPDSRLRMKLCDLLVNPYTEPLILLLIIAQTVLLTIESAPSVFSEGHGRPERWGTRSIDWALLGLFIIFTLELITRIIVSGFILNAAEYSTIDRKRGIRVAIAEQYRAVFQPERHKTANKISRNFAEEPSAISRSFTTLMQGQQALPATLAEQQRLHLARRAFLRHSFNRLDFIAVVSFWISFLLGISGIEYHHRLYVFKMLSCLRILRLLALTHGTAVILRSLKKAAPLLIRVAFLIIFFWLLFAIIGVQSFKASLSRTCVWLDPDNPTDLSASFTNEDQFCGGHLDQDTGEKLPWVRMGSSNSLINLINGTDKGKGYLCPRGSICLEQGSPNNETVNFDNVGQSLELVFVIMTANTFSNIMYSTMGSDYSFAALFFGGGIMVLTLWLVNLLIAVITSSFQVIREESKSSAFTAEHHAMPQPSEEGFRRVTAIQRVYQKTRHLWIIIIAVGLLVQALRSTEMSKSREKFIDVTEVIVTIVLDIEMALRIIANWRHFHRSWQNLFDLSLAVITSIILIPPIRETRAYWWLTAFQILRVYRVVLAIPVTRGLILLVLGNAAGIANLMMFVFLTTFLVSILAAQLFRGTIPVYEDGELNRVSFYTIYNSFLGMYQLMTSENWTDILFNVTSYNKEYHTSWAGATFLICWFILSFFILINMFIAVIQENFDVSEDEKRLEQVKAFLQRKEVDTSASNLALSTIFNFGKKQKRRDPLDYGPAMTEMLLKDAVVKEFLDDSPDPLHDGLGEIAAPQRAQTTLLGDVKPGTLSNLWGKLVRRIVKREPNPFYSNIKFNHTTEGLDARQMAQQAVNATSARRRAQREYLTRHPKYNISLYLFHPKNRIRHLCQRLVGPARGSERIDGVEPNKIAWYTFSAFVYAATVAMVIIACIATPLYQMEYQEQHGYRFTNWYVWSDLAFAIVFSVESVIKVIADGLVHTPNAYLRSSWGFVDAVVLVTLWINVVTMFVNDGAISRAVGAFKALRALRLLNVSNSARDTFHSLIIVGWWKIFGAAFVSISLLIPFAIYGLNLFAGQLVACNDGDNINTLADCFGEFSSVPFSDDWPLLAPRAASNPYFNFDDFGAALFSLFQIVSQEGWTDCSFGVQAMTGRGMQPKDLASEGNALFFVVFNLLATVFVLTLFISVFMRNYTEQTGVAYLTAEQRSWLELRKLLLQISPSKSSYDGTQKKTWKRWCHKRAIEKRGKWYQAITIILVLHLLLLLIEFDGESIVWTKLRPFIYLIFILFYAANNVIRIFGLGWARYRRSSWDLFALGCVTGAFISTMALLVATPTISHTDTPMQVHKIFLVALVLLIIPRNDALDQLFKTAAASLTVIGNLLATWLVLFLVFAIAFTQAFSLTRFGEEAGSDINFRTVPKALILLFRMSFGEGWNGVMEDYAAIEPPLCVEEADFFKSDCGSKPWARFLFVSWNILSMYIFVSLFVSLIYESFSYVYQRSSGVAAVDRDELRRFKEAWRSVDPGGTGAISKEVFPDLLSELSGVFSMRIYDHEDSVHSILDDVRDDTKTARHMSIASTSAYNNVDIKKLNDRLALLDVEKIRERRRKFKVFYEEVLVSADPELGITFTSVLMILAHYNIINDSKSLKLEEFLRRRARLQRVDDSVRRKTVQGFFDTLYWARRFRKHMEAKRASRMTAIPQLDIPNILVNDDSENRAKKDKAEQRRSDAPSTASPTHLSVDGAFGQQRLSLRGRPESTWHTTSGHPLSMPRSPSVSPSPPLSPSAFGFDPNEPGFDGPASGEVSRRGSNAVSPAQARDMLDDSVWLESIRRSTTSRRSDRGSHRYADLGR